MSWEHLQNVLMQVQNRLVRDEFSDQSGDDDDIRTPRASLRSACLLRDADSATITLNRLLLFYLMLRKASDFHPPIYSIPSDRYQQLVRFAPQVTLYFREDREDVEEGYAPIDAEVSFRIQNETETSITQAELRSLALKIRSEFATGNGYRWRKGRTTLCYRDPDRGYLMRVQAYSESEGKELIDKILDLQGHTVDRALLTINQLDQAPPIVPPLHTILGKSRRQPRRRPVGYVRFQWAEVHIWSIQEAIILIDRTGRRRAPLVEAA